MYLNYLPTTNALTQSSKVAQHITEAAPAEKRIIIDAFAGAGGNAIAFASSGRWKRVYAIEKDPQVLACAKHNAEVYGVGDKISWYEGDCFSIIEKELADIGEYSVVFASPPWGGKCNCSISLAWAKAVTDIGQAYRTDSVFNLSNMQPYSLSDILHPFQRLIGDVVLYLPRTSDLRQLATFAVNDQKVTVIHYCMEGASKVCFISWCGRTYDSLLTMLGSLCVLWRLPAALVQTRPERLTAGLHI